MARAPNADEAGSLQDLSRRERLLLMRFVCSFAWADLEVQREERELVAELIRRLEFDRDERRQILAWLELPPAPESVDPALVPRAHRLKFLRAVEATVEVDGHVSPEEQESLAVFAQLIRSDSS